MHVEVYREREERAGSWPGWEEEEIDEWVCLPVKMPIPVARVMEIIFRENCMVRGEGMGVVGLGWVCVWVVG